MTNEIIEEYLVNNHNWHLNDTKFRKSLRDWIMVAWEWECVVMAFSNEDTYMIFMKQFRLAKVNIKSALGKSWSEVRKELEE